MAAAASSLTSVFFDLDGTLTDPRPGIVRSIQHALKSLNRTVLPEEELLWCIGPPLRESFAELLAIDGADHSELIEAAVDRYRDYFSETGLYENAVYPGVEACLARLQAEGLELAVVTSKPHVYAERVLEHFDLRRFFGHVFGAELSGERSAKTELVAHALRTLTCRADAACMIGDRAQDMRGAVANDVRALGVLYGYGSASELEGAGATALAADVPEVAAWVLSLR
ncbi:MAG: HAD hydrolase-like protein [Pseudomonadota bacterium]